MAFDITTIPPAVIAALEADGVALLEEKFGLTVENFASYLAKSTAENPQFTPDERRKDAAEYGKHALRIGENAPFALGDAVDVVWPLIEPYAFSLTDAALAGGA